MVVTVDTVKNKKLAQNETSFLFLTVFIHFL